MKYGVGIGVLVLLLGLGTPWETEAAYNTFYQDTTMVPWGYTVKGVLRCPKIDFDGLGGRLITYIGGKATWTVAGGQALVTGVTFIKKGNVRNGYRAILENFAIYEPYPDKKFSALLYIKIKCRYEEPELHDSNDILDQLLDDETDIEEE